MAVYVDNARIPARVGGTRGHWSHLIADTDEELHALAERIGLKREWFQAKCKYGGCNPRAPYTAPISPCPHAHYDVTDSKRAEAIAAGAEAIDIRKVGDIIRRRRDALRVKQGGSQ